MCSLFTKDADIIIAGFDVTDPGSLDDCDDWIRVARQSSPSCRVVVAVGNKIDLVSERRISEEDARNHFDAMDPPLPYFESSAKTGEGVNELFDTVVRLWLGKPSRENDNECDAEARNCIIC